MKKLDQRGAVSLISVMLFSFIIIIVASAFIRNIVLQQRESINYDLKTRASYAAEVGVQDAVRELNAGTIPLGTGRPNQCRPTAPPPTWGTIDAGSDLSYTCQIVNVKPGELTGSVDPNQLSNTVPVQPDDDSHGPYTLTVFWSDPTNDAPIYPTKFPRPDTNKTFESIWCWHRADSNCPHDLARNGPIHPALRINIISHPRAGQLDRSNIHQTVLIFNPTPDGSAETPYVYNDGFKSNQDRDQFISNADCRPSNGGHPFTSGPKDGLFCKIDVTLDPNFDLGNLTGHNNLYVHVASIYASSSWKLQLSPSGGTPFNLVNSQAIIDVTGRASNVFNRVKQTVPIQPPVVLGSDAAFTIGDGICKSYLVTNDPASYKPRTNVCDPDNPEYTP